MNLHLLTCNKLLLFFKKKGGHVAKHSLWGPIYASNGTMRMRRVGMNLINWGLPAKMGT